MSTTTDFPAKPDASRPKSQAERKAKSARKKLYDLHSWVGFHLALLMGVILFTGTIATISNEIDWMFQHDMRVTPGEQRVSWAEMDQAIRDYAPDRNIGSIQSMGGDYLAYRARVYDQFGNQSFVHVDQWTGEVTGETHPFTVQRFFRDLHRYLFMPNVIALPIVCSMAFVLLISLYTGLKTSRNWWTLMTRLRTDKGARIFWGDAHKAAGLWSLWFFVVIAITGIWYLLEWGYGVAGTKMVPDRPSIAVERVIEYGDLIDDRPLAEIVAAAKSAYPEQEITTIQYPLRPDATFTVLGTNSNPVLRERANMVFVDPEDASVIKVMTEHDMDTVGYLNEMADPLHFGNFGGLTTKLIWFVFGVFMTGLSFTGVWLTWRRMRSKKISRAQLATTPIMLATIILGYFYVDRYLEIEKAPESENFFAKQEWRTGATIQLTEANVGKGKTDHRLVLRAKGRPNIKEIELCADDRCENEELSAHGASMSVPFGFENPNEGIVRTYTATLRFTDKSERKIAWTNPPFSQSGHR